MKTLYVLVRKSEDQVVGLFTTRAEARLDKQASKSHCCAVLELERRDVLKLLKRKTLKPGIHTVYFTVEPK